MRFEDQRNVCARCGAEFVFSAGEQEYFAKKGFENPPKRCRRCRSASRLPGSRREDPAAGIADPALGDVRCSACGAPTRVPFRPDGIRPVFCRTCFQERRRSRARGG